MRYAINTHFHWDPSHGNGRLSVLGAEVVAASTARESYARAERDFKRARDERHSEYEEIEYVAPSIWFDEAMVLDDGTQRVELLFLDPAHTAEDALV